MADKLSSEAIFQVEILRNAMGHCAKNSSKQPMTRESCVMTSVTKVLFQHSFSVMFEYDDLHSI